MGNMPNHALNRSREETPHRLAFDRSSPLRGYERERGVNRGTPPLRVDEPRGGTDKRFTPRSRYATKRINMKKALFSSLVLFLVLVKIKAIPEG